MCTIRLVSDAALPLEHDFVVIQTDGEEYAFLRESAATPAMLEDVQAACRALGAPVPHALRLA